MPPQIENLSKSKSSHKRTLFISAIIFIFLILILTVGWTLYTEIGPKHFEGIVYDCETNQPIPGAKVELWQKTIFTWDKNHIYSDITDQDGTFYINYTVGDTVHARVTKEGYLLADEWGQEGLTRIGLLNKKDTDRVTANSRMCRRSSECYETKEENGISTTQNTCGTLPHFEYE